jgi:KEOPS complex subunit Cgi121
MNQPLDPESRKEPGWDIRAGTITTDDPGPVITWIRDIEKKYRSNIVCFNADLMAGIAHARCAMRHAVRSWTTHDAIAHSFGMEALLFAGATRQCQEAVRFGLNAGENRLFLGLWPYYDAVWDHLSERFTPVPLDSWEIISDEKKKVLQELFRITPEELVVTGEERLGELVIERMALLVVNR